MTDDWFWEGNVVNAIAKHVTDAGWTIEAMADTASGQTGPDIRARKNDSLPIVEVKGYPSRFYERGTKKGQPKPTNPATQAKHWFAEALLTAIRRQTANGRCGVAIAFPDFPLYAKLLRETRDALAKLDIAVFIVHESGAVALHGKNLEAVAGRRSEASVANT